MKEKKQDYLSVIPRKNYADFEKLTGKDLALFTNSTLQNIKEEDYTEEEHKKVIFYTLVRTSYSNEILFHDSHFLMGKTVFRTSDVAGMMDRAMRAAVDVCLDDAFRWSDADLAKEAMMHTGFLSMVIVQDKEAVHMVSEVIIDSKLLHQFCPKDGYKFVSISDVIEGKIEGERNNLEEHLLSIGAIKIVAPKKESEKNADV